MQKIGMRLDPHGDFDHPECRKSDAQASRPVSNLSRPSAIHVKHGTGRLVTPEREKVGACVEVEFPATPSCHPNCGANSIIGAMTPHLETSRLILRPLALSDAEQTQRLFPQWEIVRFLNASVPWPYPPDGALSFYRDVALPAVEGGFEWHWTLRLKSAPGLHIGTILLAEQADDNRGFWLGLPWQGRGLMSEALIAVTDFWFGALGRTTLRTKKASGNMASIRLSEKTGMRKTGTQMHHFVSGELPAEIWEINADEWAQHIRERA